MVFGNIAKISRPVLGNVFPRERLFLRMDETEKRLAIWISGPAGIGKSTLISSYIDDQSLPCFWYQIDAGDTDVASFFHYLSQSAASCGYSGDLLPVYSPEHSENIGSFSRLFFRTFFTGLPNNCTFVFDDCHLLEPDSPIYKIISVEIEQITKFVHLFIASREDPPATFSRLLLNRKISLISSGEMQLQEDEAIGIGSFWPSWDNQVDQIQTLNEAVKGWTAGFILALEHGGADEQIFSSWAKQTVFDYFASELLQRLPETTETFLLKTAFAPDLTAEIASNISGQKGANIILNDLYRRNLFTELREDQETVFRYHPLFREFLIDRAKKTYTTIQIEGLINKTAEALEANNYAEDAVDLYKMPQNWQQVARIACELAPSLLSVGRWKVLELWIKDLPQDLLNQDACLCYWYGAAVMQVDVKEARKLFKTAYNLFGISDDYAGILTSWCGIVDSIVLEWDDFKKLDNWISQMELILASHDSYPCEEIEASLAFSMFSALMFRQPGHPQMKAWTEKALHCARRDVPIAQRIITSGYQIQYRHWIGDMIGAQSVLEEFQDTFNETTTISPLVFGIWKMHEAVYYWHQGLIDECIQAVEDGLARGESEGVHLVDHWILAQAIYANLSSDHLDIAKQYLDRMKPVLQSRRRLDIGHYHFLLSYYYLQKGLIEQALGHSEIALNFAIETGTPFPQGLNLIFAAQIHHELGHSEQAQMLLSHAYQIAKSMYSHGLRHMAGLVTASIEFDHGNLAQGNKVLAESLKIGKSQQIINFGGWRPNIMAQLCTRALQAGIETNYVQTLIRRMHLMPESLPLDVDDWPWSIKIYTLGRFEIQIDTVPLHFKTKAQNRTLDLLKALIALGGRDVHEQTLADAVWPDSEGDAAIQALNTTLHRLRKLVEHKDAFIRSENRLSLNPKVCWADQLAFERMLNQAETMETSEQTKTANLIEQALHLYQGAFLQSDIDHSWVVSLRERLQRKHIRAVKQLAKHWNRQSKPRKNIKLYEKALDVNDVVEPFYQGLINCHLKLGQKSEAVSVYQRCCKTLLAKLGTEPTFKTQSMIKESS